MDALQKVFKDISEIVSQTDASKLPSDFPVGVSVLISGKYVVKHIGSFYFANSDLNKVIEYLSNKLEEYQNA